MPLPAKIAEILRTIDDPDVLHVFLKLWSIAEHVDHVDGFIKSFQDTALDDGIGLDVDIKIALRSFPALKLAFGTSLVRRRCVDCNHADEREITTSIDPTLIGTNRWPRCCSHTGGHDIQIETTSLVAPPQLELVLGEHKGQDAVDVLWISSLDEDANVLWVANYGWWVDGRQVDRRLTSGVVQICRKVN